MQPHHAKNCRHFYKRGTNAYSRDVETKSKRENQKTDNLLWTSLCRHDIREVQCTYRSILRRLSIPIRRVKLRSFIKDKIVKKYEDKKIIQSNKNRKISNKQIITRFRRLLRKFSTSNCGSPPPTCKNTEEFENFRKLNFR